MEIWYAYKIIVGKKFWLVLSARNVTLVLLRRLGLFCWWYFCISFWFGALDDVKYSEHCLLFCTNSMSSTEKATSRSLSVKCGWLLVRTNNLGLKHCRNLGEQFHDSGCKMICKNVVLINKSIWIDTVVGTDRGTYNCEKLFLEEPVGFPSKSTTITHDVLLTPASQDGKFCSVYTAQDLLSWRVT